MPTTTRTLCPYCGVGCGLLAHTEGGRLTGVEGGRLIGVEGDPLYPVNRGRTCRKPRELPAAVHARDRALHPLVRDVRGGRMRACGWTEAIDAAAGLLQAIRERHGPDSIAFYISGQLLTEDYYAAVKLVKGFLGTNNLDSNSRLCMSSAVAGYTGAFGADGPPPAYADIELADCFLLLGSNAAACHPILWSRIQDRRREGAFVICADPRPTATTRQSDLHLPVRPGTDLALLNALLHVVIRDGLHDEDFIRLHTDGFDEAAGVAADWPPERAAGVCGVRADEIEAAARRFGEAPRAMALWSMGANQSTLGTMKNRALINLCLATGQIGRPGTGPLSLTGQPNAMGGRETGGLAHLLPGYRRVDCEADRTEIERIWRCPPLSDRPGLPAVELFDALADGRIKAVWIVATNPIVSLPTGRRAREALERAELVVVQDAYHPTETSALADVVLPAAAWPEKTGTMTNSERRVGLVRAALDAPGEALADWRIFARVAAALGHGEHFAWEDESAVFDEFAGATAGRPCDMTGISHERLRREGSLQWPCPAADVDVHDGTARLYVDRRFHTPDGRARFAPGQHAPALPAAELAEPPSDEFRLTLTTGRVADHWHTMTRTGKSPALTGASREPVLECADSDAAAAGIADGSFAAVVSRRGRAVLKVKLVRGMPPGVAFAPMHWGALHAPAGAGTVNALTHDATDPVSHQPELKAIAVRLEPVAPARSPIVDNFVGDLRSPRRLVVVGTGMAGLAVVEEVLRRRPGGSWRITMLGEEPDPVYNRMLLSKLLARTCGRGELELHPPAWYAAHGVCFRPGAPAAHVDLDARTVIDSGGRRHEFDALVLATGSRPFVPPIDGSDLAHVHTFRTLRDAGAIAASAIPGRPAAVIGGGLLGLEAAAGLVARGMPVTVIELADRIMPQQLGRSAAETLARALERLGMHFRVGRSVRAIDEDGVTLDDGERIAASLVVIAAGIRPETTLAITANIEVGTAILVDDELRTSAPGVWAVGECAEHEGVVQGLWAPIAEQARAAGAAIVGDPAAFHGTTTATTLKIAGVDLFAGGLTHAAPQHDEVVHLDTRRMSHRRLLLDGERLVGAQLVGETADARTLSELLRSGAPVPETLLASGNAPRALPADDAAVVCSCNDVTRGAILAAVRTGGLTTVAQVGRATRAATGCGSCTRDVEELLGHASSPDRNMSGTTEKRRGATIAA